MLHKFIKDFYNTLSFETSNDWKEEEFRDFFLSDAVLMECKDGIYQRKTIEEYISEFSAVIKFHPEIFEKGFQEKQVNVKVIENDISTLVSSEYEKTYQVEGKDIKEFGTNNMTVIQKDGTLKIACLVW